MTIQATFMSQKKGAAQLIHSLFGSDGSEIAAVLERELGEQVRYDHREVDPSVLDAQWKELPAIASLVGQGSASDLEALKASSYAFRLMTLAQCRVRMPESARSAMLSILDDFGLGMKEVESYAKDFVR